MYACVCGGLCVTLLSKQQSPHTVSMALFVCFDKAEEKLSNPQDSIARDLPLSVVSSGITHRQQPQRHCTQSSSMCVP